MRIEGSAAIVTGGASGLGHATAAMLVAAGAKVTLFDIEAEAGQAVDEQIGARFVSVNVTDEASVQAGFADAETAHGAARILVNCAGIAPVARVVDKTGAGRPLALIRKVVEVNLIGSFATATASATAATKLDVEGEERGVIINTASVAAFEGQVGQAAYAASKAGISGLTLPLARDLALYAIRVVTIAASR